jgi:hypothetical protein
MRNVWNGITRARARLYVRSLQYVAKRGWEVSVVDSVPACLFLA